MNLYIDTPLQEPQKLLRRVESYLLKCQHDDGAVPWFTDGKVDPWDHVEALMGFNIAGNFAAARKGFLWLQEKQNPDGSWYAKYYGDLSDSDSDRNKIETNFVAYAACGLWHYLCTSKDFDFARMLFPTIAKAMDFVLQQQGPEGDIQWALSSSESLPNDALITASASILRSLECAIQLADALAIPHQWQSAYGHLADALKNKPWRFDRTWEPKTRFSMDWFYPILSGIYTPSEARLRLAERWQEFVHPELGCRCVSDEAWVTVAESCELCLALVAAGERNKAEIIFSQLLRWQDLDGGFWTGYAFRDKVIWPQEKTTWTTAAMLLAADAIYHITPAATIFTAPSTLFFTQETQ